MINQSHKLSGPFLIDLKNRFRQIAGTDNRIDRKEFKNGLIQSDDPYIDWTDEFYWGAFQLSGDWRRVDFD